MLFVGLWVLCLLCRWASPLVRLRRGVDCTCPKPSLGWCWAIGKPKDTALGGKHILRHRTSGTCLGVPRLVKRLGHGVCKLLDT